MAKINYLDAVAVATLLFQAYLEVSKKWLDFIYNSHSKIIHHSLHCTEVINTPKQGFFLGSAFISSFYVDKECDTGLCPVSYTSALLCSLVPSF
jgi:hypothetical protein